MLESHTRQIDTVDKTSQKKMHKEQLGGDKQKCRLGTARNEITGGVGASTSLRSTNPRP